LEDHYPSITIELDPVEARQLHRTLSGLSSTLSSSLETNQGKEVKSILQQLQDFFSLTDSATQIPFPPALDSPLLPPDSSSPSLSPYPTSNLDEVTPTPTEELPTTTSIAEEEQVPTISITPPETLSSSFSVSEIKVSLPPSPSSLHSEKWTTCVIKAEKLHLAGLIDSIFGEQEEKVNPRPDEGLSILEHISDQLRNAKPHVLRISRSKADISALRSKQGHRMPPPVTNLLSFPSLSPPRKPSINSELVRLRTFLNNWPHPEYQYATPNKLAEAGFFLQPADTFPDRCFCFSCSIALVSWEPADDPWTEHKRHAPNCAFISGKPTLNIPLSVTLGKAGSIEHLISDNTQLNEPVSASLFSTFPGAY
jgi:hypothetical protein